MGSSWHFRTKAILNEIEPAANTFQRTLKFINSDASSIHGCVRVGSIYTSESGEWKMGGFEVLSSVKDDESCIYVGAVYVQCIAPKANLE